MVTLLVIADRHTTGANAVNREYASPLRTVGISPVTGRGNPGGKEIAAIIMRLAGVVLCFMPGLSPKSGAISPMGDSLAVGSVVFFALMTLVLRRSD